MAKREKKLVHHVQMTEASAPSFINSFRNTILRLLKIFRMPS